MFWVFSLVFSFCCFVLSQSACSVQTLLRCPSSPRLHSHASTQVSTLKIPNTGSHANVCTSEFLQALTGMGSASLAAAVRYPDKATRSFRKGQRSNKSNKFKCGKMYENETCLYRFSETLFLTHARKTNIPLNRLYLLSGDVTVANTSARQVRTVSHTSLH